MLLELLSKFACRPTRFLSLSKAGLDLDACNRKIIGVGSNKPGFFQNTPPCYQLDILQSDKAVNFLPSPLQIYTV